MYIDGRFNGQVLVVTKFKTITPEIYIAENQLFK